MIISHIWNIIGDILDKVVVVVERVRVFWNFGFKCFGVVENVIKK